MTSSSSISLYLFFGIMSGIKAFATGTSVPPPPTSSCPTKLTLWISKSCPYAQRCYISILEKGIDTELKIVNLEQKTEEFNQLYASLNVDPMASSKVPILEDTDGTRLIESAVIAQYIEDKYPLSGTYLLPSSATDRAIQRLFVETFANTLQTLPYKCIQTSPDKRNDLLEQLHSAVKILDKFLIKYGSNQGPFLFGNDFTLAEVMTGPFVQRIVPIGKHFAGFDLMVECQTCGCDRLLLWLQATLNRKSLLTSKLPDDILIASYEKVKNRLTNTKT